MGKLGENVPLLIDKAVDFMASSQAFREYLKKLPPRNAIPSGIPDESVPLYLQRLEERRRIYRRREGQAQTLLYREGFFFKLILEISSVSERTIVDRTACW
ncbi:hypothetical protein DJICPGNB_18075 [Escherichia coli]|nr:hypothetical protein DJICPGNB_18075 [Escherichia coli]